MSETTKPKRIYRSNDEKMLAGVCGGVAKYMDMDPTIVRLIWAGTVVFVGFGFFMYILAAIIVPEEPKEEKTPVAEPQAESNSN